MNRRLMALLLGAGCAGPVLQPMPGDSQPADDVAQRIEDEYQRDVRPIFAASCLHCHGAGDRLPWYHALPIVRRMIDEDIAKARRSVDLSHGFPLRGRERQLDYLQAIEGVLDDGSMPPLRYRLLHWSATLDDAQKLTVRHFISDARAWIASGH